GRDVSNVVKHRRQTSKVPEFPIDQLSFAEALERLVVFTVIVMHNSHPGDATRCSKTVAKLVSNRDAFVKALQRQLKLTTKQMYSPHAAEHQRHPETIVKIFGESPRPGQFLERVIVPVKQVRRHPNLPMRTGLRRAIPVLFGQPESLALQVLRSLPVNQIRQQSGHMVKDRHVFLWGSCNA